MPYSNLNISYETNYAHGEGFTCICYNKEGNSLITGGSDGEVRLWIPDDPNHDVESFSAGSSIFSLCIKNDHFFVASDLNDLKEYKLSNGSFVEIKARFTSNIYCLDLSSTQKYLAAGAGDFMIKIISLEDSTLKTISGHEAPILCVSFDPQSIFLASSSCDGTVKIWNLDSLECVKTWKNHPKSNDFINSSTLCKISWDKQGNYLLVPSLNCVNVYERNSWNLKRSFSYEGFNNINLCQTSLNDKYLAAANNTGSVLIWDYFNSKVVAIFANKKEASVTCLQWHPLNLKQLVISDIKGEYHLISIGDYVSKDNESDLLTLRFDMDDDLLEDATIQENIDSNKIPNTCDQFSQEENEPLKSSVSPVLDYASDASENGELNLDDENEFDIGAIKRTYEPKIFCDSEKKDESRSFSDLDPNIAKALNRINQMILPIVQPPFQPGSSPIEFQERYMVWNSIGIVCCYSTETENTIDVEFHDTSIHHSLHIPNTDGFTMADLSNEALILANSRSEEMLNSRLFCKCLNSWEQNEWKFDIPESIEAISTSGGLVVVATDARNIRLYTLGGIQLFIFTIPGPVVCLSSQEQTTMILHHMGSGLPGEQSISMIVFKLDPKQIKKIKQFNTPVALSSKSTVAWGGFSDEGTPCIVDSKGIVRLWKECIGNFWMTIANLRDHAKSKQDYYFVIGLTEIEQKIRAISCKGSRYPSLVPKPLPCLFDFKIPVCHYETTKSKFEEQYSKLFVSESLLTSLLAKGFDVDFQLGLNEKKLNETLIKMFALGINSGNETLAIEVAYLMNSQKTLEGALKYVTQKRKTAIAHKLQSIIDEKMEEEEEELEEEEEIFIPSPGKQSSLADNEDNKVIKPKIIINKGPRFDECENVPKPKPMVFGKKRSLEDTESDVSNKKR